MATAIRQMMPPSATAFATRLPLRPQVRTQLIELLNRRLADMVDLQLQAKHAHWNVRGRSFLPLHELFERIAAEAAAHADLLAERAVQLGGLAEGLLPTLVERSELGRHRPPLAGEADYLTSLADALAALSERLRQGVIESEALSDAPSEDILTEISRAVEKLLWQVEAHAPVKAG